MPVDKKFIGKSYPAKHYEVGKEKIREFAYAVGGTIPSLGFSGIGPPEKLDKVYYDEDVAKASKYKSLIALPSFANVFAIAIFGEAVTDPELNIDMTRLVHGEQEYEFDEVVRPGDHLTTTGKISDIYSKKNLDFVVVETVTVNQHQKRVVTARWTAVVRNGD